MEPWTIEQWIEELRGHRSTGLTLSQQGCRDLATLLSNFDHIKRGGEQHPGALLILRVEPDGKYYVTGGDPVPGEGDRPCIALEYIRITPRQQPGSE